VVIIFQPDPGEYSTVNREDADASSPAAARVEWSTAATRPDINGTC